MLIYKKITIIMVVALALLMIPCIIAGFIIQVACRIGTSIAYLLWFDIASAKHEWKELKCSLLNENCFDKREVTGECVDEFRDDETDVIFKDITNNKEEL